MVWTLHLIYRTRTTSGVQTTTSLRWPKALCAFVPPSAKSILLERRAGWSRGTKPNILKPCENLKNQHHRVNHFDSKIRVPEFNRWSFPFTAFVGFYCVQPYLLIPFLPNNIKNWHFWASPITIINTFFYMLMILEYCQSVPRSLICRLGNGTKPNIIKSWNKLTNQRLNSWYLLGFTPCNPTYWTTWQYLHLNNFYIS